ncbi:MAG: FAD-binding protein [Erysipelotrichaceae bacterium]|nr:FAD-binding protein [Erysipelotrichaceae bacterium]
MLQISQFKVYKDLDPKEVIDMALRKYRVNDAYYTEIINRSIDARDKNDIHYVYTINIKVKDESRYPKLKKVKEYAEPEITVRRKSGQYPIIIGSGPAGLFCALELIEHGVKPIIIEQGSKVEDRIEDVRLYREKGIIKKMSNVQFGEGGAGTFSDGKLTTGISSPYIRKVLKTFVKFGAPEEISYLQKPHIGTDNLIHILAAIRRYIEDNGGTYYFNTRFDSFEMDGRLIRVICDKCEFFTDTLVLAIGHSGRSTFEMLREKNMKMQRKNFSVGLRIEHKRKMIDESQYGTKSNLNLPAAEYKLVYHGKERTCYTFCMCPGGEVIASSSDENSIVTNGMSYYKRDGENSNSALLVNINADDFEGDDVLSGMHFQKQLEEKAFVLAGSNYHAPVQRVEDFHNKVASNHIGNITPTYKPGYVLCDLNEILPDFVSDTIREALPYFDNRLHGFNDPDAILTGVETRTSSPVTIIRDENLQSSIKGIYPCGEGAGMAGGITSAAVDGIKVAVSILQKEQD